jgi:aspartate/methionine/tyrosine aminotransferase
VILNSPSNPTGTTYSREDYAALVEVLQKHPRIWVISDEIYDLLVYEGKAVSFLELEALRERTIVCNGFSKAFAMPGWRLGYLIAPLDIAQAASKVQGQTTAGANLIAQKAAIAGLTGDIESLIAPMRKAFQERRDTIYQYLSQHHAELHPYKPQGAFYFFLDFSAYLGKRTPQGAVLRTADDIADYLLEEGLALVPGTGFGMNTHIRLSYAVALSDIEIGLVRLTQALHALA